MILYLVTSEGGFLCGDLERGVADYAYPTSHYAQRAHQQPLKVARHMLAKLSHELVDRRPELRQRNHDRLFALRRLREQMAADTYVYRGALLCGVCGWHRRVAIGLESDAARYGDSDQYPQGPYPDGGGEADCPQHCDGCGTFLENPLTDDGEVYVREAVDDAERDGEVNGALAAWRERYGYLFEGGTA